MINEVDGLHWFDPGTDGSKPVIVFVHGNSWIASKLSSCWPVDRFIRSGWNVAAFRWKDHNSPSEALRGKNCEASEAAKLAGELIRFINTGCDCNEIRLVGHSWGVFVVSFAAKKLADYIAHNVKKILVTVDLIEPVPTRAADSIRTTLLTIPVSILFPALVIGSLMGTEKYTDDEGTVDWGDTLIARYLNHISARTTVPVKPGLRQFNVIYCARGFSWSDLVWSDFYHCTSGLIKRYRIDEKRAEFKLFRKRTWSHTDAYKLYTDCDLADYTQTRV